MKLGILIAVLPGIGLAFSPSVPHASTRGRSSSRVVLLAERETPTGREDKKVPSLKDGLLRPFGTVLVAASLVFNPGSAIGAGIETTAYGFSVSSPVTSSSLQVAEAEIKLLDMSLPSYGSISAPKANTDAVGYAKEDQSVQAAAAASKKKASVAVKKTKQPPAAAAAATEKRKPVPKQPFVKEPVVKRDRALDSDEKLDVRNNFKSKPVFVDKDEVSVEQKKKEKADKKADKKSAKKADKEAVVASEEDKDDGLSLKDVTIVDMEMPSYDGSTTKKSKSVFAL